MKISNKNIFNGTRVRQTACLSAVSPACQFLKDVMKKGILNRAWQQVMT